MCYVAHSQCAFAQCVAHSQHALTAILHIMNMLWQGKRPFWTHYETETILLCTLWAYILAIVCTFAMCIVVCSQCAFAQCVAHWQHALPDILHIMNMLWQGKHPFWAHYRTEIVKLWRVYDQCILACLQHASMHIVNVLLGDNLHIHNV